MSWLSEFATVDAVIGCSAETSGVDAFALSVIKAERQIRKLFTHLVFQSPGFGPADVPRLRKALFDSRVSTSRASLLAGMLFIRAR
jgi:hypothetical protein